MALTSQVPQSVPELLDLDLAISPHRAGTASSDEVGRWSKAVLRAVAYSRGLGMPATVIRRLAPLILPGDDVSGEISPALLRKVLERVRFYLRSSPEVDGTTLYRIFHQGLVDHLRVPDSALGGLYDRLMERTAMGPDGQRYVAAAEPYVARHAVEHAVDAGRLDELVHVDSEALRTLFNAVQTGPGRIAAAIWRQSDTDPHASGSVSQVSPVEVRRDLLSLDAIRFGADEVAARLTSVPGLRPRCGVRCGRPTDSWTVRNSGPYSPRKMA